MQEYLDLFQSFGLTEKEGALYLALLELGPAPVSTIAARASVKRPTAYFVLRDLEMKGFVSSVLSGKTKKFIAEDPKKLVAIEKTKLTDLERALPGLLGLASKNQYKPGVRFFSGKAGVKAVYEESLLQPPNAEMLAIGHAQIVEENIPGFQEWYIKRRVAARIHMRALTPATRGGVKVKERDAFELRETRLLDPGAFTAGVEINIYGNTISIVSLIEHEFVGIIIESTVLAMAQRQMFEILWSTAKGFER
jgi:hypothetical protein